MSFFTKEAVALPAAHAQPSLLSATLLACQASPAAGEGAHSSSRERHHRGSGSGRESPTHTTRHVTGYAVAEAIAVIVDTYFSQEGGVEDSSSSSSSKQQQALPLSRYSLLVADDDGTVADPDFPEIDPSVPITSVGVDKFVLVQRGAGSDLATTPRCGDPSGAGGGSDADVILLRVTIPQASIALRACEVGSGAAPSLTLTCYAPKDSGASSSFSVQLTGGGSAKPLAGLAAPSEQSQAALSAALAAALQGPP